MRIDEKTQQPLIGRRKMVVTTVALILWCFFLWRAVQVFTPGAYSAAVFNSDCAVPVLMANNNRPPAIFDLYYYGHDRWGAWPLFAPQLIHRLTGYHWSPQSLSMLQTTWLFLGAIFIGALSRRDPVLVGLGFLLAVCVFAHPENQIFLLSHVHAWQIPMLLISWYCLRRFFVLRPDGLKRPRDRAVWFLTTFVFCYLAIWSSVTSIPILLFLFCLETVRASFARCGSPRERLWPTFIKGLIPIGAAALVERFQVFLYHRSAMQQFGTDFRTSLALDYGHLAQNFGIQLLKLTNAKWWVLSFVASVVVIVAACALGYAWLGKRNDWRPRLIELLRNDTVVLAIGSYGIAVINFVLSVIASHVRMNNYDERYLLLTNLFSAFSGALSIFLIVQLIARRWPFGVWVKTGFLVAGVVLLTMAFPRKTHQPDYQPAQNAALQLAERSPGAIVLGDYWGVYVFAALQPTNTMVPVPFEGQLNRLPWTRALVAGANELTVQYPSSQLTRSAGPAERLAQYGAGFKLTERVWYDNGVFAFARYVRDDASAAPEDPVKAASLARQPFVDILNREPEPGEVEEFRNRILPCHAEASCVLEQQLRANVTLLHSTEFQAGGGFIYRLYSVALGRAPNHDEWERNRQRLTELGNNGSLLIEDWMRQPQFLERYPASLTNSEFRDKVLQIAKPVIEPAQLPGLAASLRKADPSRSTVMMHIVNQARPIASDEDAFVTLCYFLYLKRDPDQSGLIYWVKLLRNGSDKTSLIAGFLNSAEYRAKFPHP